ncbi:unnamed protein product, partial [Ectocarpus fasciculatus]
PRDSPKLKQQQQQQQQQQQHPEREKGSPPSRQPRGRNWTMYALHRGGAVAATASAAAKNASSSRSPLSQVAMTRRALCLARLHSSTGSATEAMRRVRAQATGGARRRAAGGRVAPVWSRSDRGMGSWTPAPGSRQERFGATVVDAALSMRESLEAKQLIW